MGQSSSIQSRRPPPPPRRSRRHRSFKSLPSMPHTDTQPDGSLAPSRPFPPPLLPPDLNIDYTSDLPDECLAIVFQSLGSGDRKRCSLVCKRWFSVEGQSRHRISLDARAALLEAVPSLFARFDSVVKLALKCDRRTDSIGDEALTLISQRCPLLTRLKLRACREVTDIGMAALAKNCKNLRKLSCGSCTFGARGVFAVLGSCKLLEELSLKRLRGLSDAAVDSVVAMTNSSLKTICLKEIYNGQCLAPLIAGSTGLRTLKLFRCSGDWDTVLEQISVKVPGLFEVHLEKLQVSDRGLCALTACVDLEVLHLVKTPECTDLGIISVVERCRLLRKILIDGLKTNRIGDEGLSAIARRCPNLQELVLIGVNPTSSSLGLIAGNCRNLERLALCASDTIGDAEILCIASKCVALKKLCIKGCPISDQGMEALAGGCPNLVKVKVKKCRGVTLDGADWLRANRGMIAVNLDSESQGIAEQLDASASDSGMQENGMEQLPVLPDHILTHDLPPSIRGRSAFSKARLGFLTRTNFMSTFRKLSRSRRSQDRA